MKKYVCKPCGWVTESETVPQQCPVCKKGPGSI